VLLGGVALGVLTGLLAGGRLWNLAAIRLRWSALLFIAVIVRFAGEAALNRGVPLAETLRLPLFAGAYAILLAGIWVNRRQPGFGPAFAGILANGVAIVVNGGAMVVWEPSLLAAGFTAADLSPFHRLLPPTLDADFLRHAGPLGDLIPVPLPFIQTVASVGDLFLSAGLAFFCFAVLVRAPGEGPETERPPGEAAHLAGLAATARLPRTVASAIEGRTVRPETGLAPGLAQASVLERPLILAGTGPGMAAPALAPLPPEIEPTAAGAVALRRAPPVPTAPPLAGLAARARRHPYIRLALNGDFSALWVGQLISLFGDRVHQVALAFLVLGATNSPVAVAGVFLAATLPNLLLGPIAGTLVDRWNQQEVMVVSDLLRAAAVLLIPVAAATNILLVYPLVFAVTSISIFFRPARTAVMPRIVRDDELLTANSATWIGETLADIGGYPLAGLFVAFLGSALPLAFWIDAATYVASAVLIATVTVPPVRRSAEAAAGAIGGFLGELKAGWRFLRKETVLLANTLQGAVGQFTVGVTLAVTPLYARDTITGSTFDASAVYAFLETGIGLGNLAGGFVMGLIGARLMKGRLVILGYATWGLCTAALAFTGSLGTAIGLMIGSGVANMIFVIPSQTLFQERTPPDLIGRVVGFRFALVFGSMTVAMGVGGLLAESFGAAPVIGAFGVVTLLAGLAGLLVPAVRDA
jgi:MFS family permease